MKKNAVYISVIIILCAVSIYLIKKPVKTTAPFDSAILKADSASVIEISFESEGNKIVLSKGLDTWQIKEPAVYDPDPAVVATLLKFVNDITLKNIISEKPDKFAKFGVDSTGSMISIRKSDNSRISYIIGSDDRDLNYSFYRIPEDNKTYLGTIFPRYRISSNVNSWRDKAITKADPEKISFLSVKSGSDIFTAERASDEWKAYLNGNPSTGDKDKIQKALSKLSSFRATDFIDTLKAADIIPEIIVSYKTDSASNFEIVLSGADRNFTAFVKEKDQAYRITEFEIVVFEDLLKK